MSRLLLLVGRVVLILLAAVAVLYFGDYASVKFQIPNRPQTRDVQIRPMIAVPEKGNKLEYILGDPVVQTCSTSLFPQLGYQPCWYVTRHKEQTINM
jgi:hypothetical protein